MDFKKELINDILIKTVKEQNINEFNICYLLFFQKQVQILTYISGFF